METNALVPPRQPLRNIYNVGPSCTLKATDSSHVTLEICTVFVQFTCNFFLVSYLEVKMTVNIMCKVAKTTKSTIIGVRVVV